jgi:SAM-dependent methyltransferase
MPTAACFADDLEFDAWLPRRLRIQSPSHFTPIEVARYVTRFLAPEGGELVLDVGAGTGKFCLVAANAQRASTFVGVEVRKQLVTIASELAATWRLSNVRFVHSDAFDLDWGAYDGFYFFNPFAEQLLAGPFLIDDTIALGRDRFDDCIAMTLDRLAMTRRGTRVVTYHGLGSELPSSFDLKQVAIVGSDRVELWVQTRSRITRPLQRVSAR